MSKNYLFSDYLIMVHNYIYLMEKDMLINLIQYFGK